MKSKRAHAITNLETRPEIPERCESATLEYSPAPGVLMTVQASAIHAVRISK